MKIAVTVNLGNYENIRVESSEYDDADECIDEIKEALARIREPIVEDFIRRVFK